MKTKDVLRRLKNRPERLSWKLLLPLLSISPIYASTDNFQDFVMNLGKTFDLARFIIVRIAFACGMGFALMGLMKFKAYKDNPAQFPLSTPIVLLAVSSGLLFFPSVVELSGSAVFGPSAKPVLNITQPLNY